MLFFSTKCRVALLADSWRDDLFVYIGRTVREHKAVLWKAGGIEDIYWSNSTSNTRSHQRSSFSRRTRHAGSTSMGRSRRGFSGYGAFSASQSMAATVKDYIASQRAHHRQCALTDEYLQMLRLHEIDFDNRRVLSPEVSNGSTGSADQSGHDCRGRSRVRNIVAKHAMPAYKIAVEICNN